MPECTTLSSENGSPPVETHPGNMQNTTSLYSTTVSNTSAETVHRAITSSEKCLIYHRESYLYCTTSFQTPMQFTSGKSHRRSDHKTKPLSPSPPPPPKLKSIIGWKRGGVTAKWGHHPAQRKCDGFLFRGSWGVTFLFILFFLCLLLLLFLSSGEKTTTKLFVPDFEVKVVENQSHPCREQLSAFKY